MTSVDSARDGERSTRAHSCCSESATVASPVFGVQFAPRVIASTPNRRSGRRSPPMKKLLVCFACTLLISLVAAAQSTKQDNSATQDTAKANPQDKQAEKPAQWTKTVTSCLQKGDEAGGLSI